MSPGIPQLLVRTETGQLLRPITPNAACIVLENRSNTCKIEPRQSGVTTVPAWRGSFALLCILGSASSAVAQRPDNFLQIFETIAQSAPMHSAQAQPERQDQDPIGQRSAYAVSGVALGATVQFDSPAFKQYKCSPSDQFEGFIRSEPVFPMAYSPYGAKLH